MQQNISCISNKEISSPLKSIFCLIITLISQLQLFAKSHPLKKRIPNSSINANLELVDYYSKPTLSPEDFLKSLRIFIAIHI